MLLKRLDVLTATFGSSGRAAERKEEMMARVASLVAALPPPAHFSADDAFTADATLLEMQRAAQRRRARAHALVCVRLDMSYYVLCLRVGRACACVGGAVRVQRMPPARRRMGI